MCKRARACIRCNIVKPIRQFTKLKRKKKTWRSHTCKACQYIVNQKWAENNPDKVKEKSRRYASKRVKELHDNYIIGNLVQTLKIKREQIKLMPELIEAKRAHLMLKRAIKHKMNEK
jgi:hypothetical protein